MKKFLILATLVFAMQAFAQPDSLWSRMFGSDENEDCHSLAQASDGGFILAGQTDATVFDYDFYVVRTDSNGDSLWTRTFGGIESQICYSAQQTLDAGFILIGVTSLESVDSVNIWLLKINADGDSMWSRTFGGEGGNWGNFVLQTADSGYVCAGSRNAFDTDSSDFWIIRLNSNGDSLWSKTFGGPGSESCRSAVETGDGSFVLAGTTSSYGSGSQDFWLLKIDADGDSLWGRTFGGSNFEECRSLGATNDGGFILGGLTLSYGQGEADSWIIKTNVSGDSLWSRTFGGAFNDICNVVKEVSGGGFVLCGASTLDTNSNYDFDVFRTNSNGDSLWGMSFGGEFSEEFCGVVQTGDRGFAIAGDMKLADGIARDFWFLRTGPDPTSSLEPTPVLPTTFSMSIYPNPFNNSATISLSVPFEINAQINLLNILGQTVMNLYSGPVYGEQQFPINATSLASGVYIVQVSDLIANTRMATEKIVLLK